MKSYSIRAPICATPERIWALLTDAPSYTSWNKTVERVEGKIALGERVTIHPKINLERAFPVKVSLFESPLRMVWTSRMPFGLFKGERTFMLKPDGNGMTEFSMCEEYSGLMAPLICRSIPDLQPAFDDFASDLKRATETK